MGSDSESLHELHDEPMLEPQKVCQQCNIPIPPGEGAKYPIAGMDTLDQGCYCALRALEYMQRKKSFQPHRSAAVNLRHKEPVKHAGIVAALRCQPGQRKQADRLGAEQLFIILISEVSVSRKARSILFPKKQYLGRTQLYFICAPPPPRADQVFQM